MMITAVAPIISPIAPIASPFVRPPSAGSTGGALARSSPTGEFTCACYAALPANSPASDSRLRIVEATFLGLRCFGIKCG